eukprot:COSAG03_NODE_594_length_6820_cov_22.278232_2_plen_53_part_00
MASLAARALLCAAADVRRSRSLSLSLARSLALALALFLSVCVGVRPTNTWVT